MPATSVPQSNRQEATAEMPPDKHGRACRGAPARANGGRGKVSSPTALRRPTRGRSNPRDGADEYEVEDQADSRPRSNQFNAKVSPYFNELDNEERQSGKVKRAQSATDPSSFRRSMSESNRSPSRTSRAHAVPANAKKQSLKRSRSRSKSPFKSSSGL